MTQEAKQGTFNKVAHQVFRKTLLVLEIILGYVAFSVTGVIGVGVVFGQFIPLGRLFNTMQGINGVPILLASFIKVILFTLVIYGLQRLHRQNMMDLGLRLPLLNWVRFLLLSVGLVIAGQGLLLMTQKLIGESAEANLATFDLGTPLSLLGWIGVGWIHGGFGEELLNRGFLFVRIEALFGKRPWSTLVAVLLLVAFFGLGHAYQGITGIILTAVTSLVFWAVYFLSGRNLWASIIAHGCWDTIGWLLIASGL